MKIVLTGGGSGGPVAPLIAIAEQIKKNKPETEFLFIGTRRGDPEKQMIKDDNFYFQSIYDGKLRRYFSWQNILDIFYIKVGFFQSFSILKKFKPDLIIGAGGYVSVPVIIAGWFLKIPSIIHQQDILPTLSNKILSFFVKKITVSFEASLKNFPTNKTILTGQPIREMIFKGNEERAMKIFNLKENKPILLVLGGGTGAVSLNNLIWQNLNELTKFFQVVHLTGINKLKIENYKLKINNYHPFEFLNQDLPDIFAVADLVISRAGINTLSELAILGKPTVIIPIPNSHQEANAKYFESREAVVVLNQSELTNYKLLDEIKKIINNKEKQDQLRENIKKIIPSDAAKKIVDNIL